MKSFTVTADTNLDILFSHVVENPKVSAIEILDASGQPGVLGSDPESLAFGSVLVGTGSTRTVRLTNLGAVR